ncbi:T9SS type A sorting domain-containing protein [Taibaiella lutea]|uniref:T9SS type A sorting domain-containing protein n=1 Tax=Taibaiella lutea TaxID=2608001 RepID=A0A5M6CHA8_9BACT|nr:T9SS type A sorting domain-containing protein [Taibaiella lutea]KAA5534544.1 T9SS type A sorting domain-containing protein [Taibaiella lutea]
MNIRIVFFSLLGLCSFTAKNQLNAQTQHSKDDCDFNDSLNAIRSYKLLLADSIELANFVPAKTVPTTACAVPSLAAVNAEFSLQNDKIYGFFKGVENANLYLVVFDEEHLSPTLPKDGVYYKAGTALGTGTVVSSNEATAFVALNLKSSKTYRINIYAANTNCVEGIRYNEVPVYSGSMKPTDPSSLNHYFGNLHSHSSYSDGNQDNTSLIPSDDYAFAKEALCMDFLGIAEHNHYSSPHNPGMHVADYAKGLQQANTFTNNNANFLALYGMEFGVISNGGHVVVYGIDSLLGWETLVGSPNYNIYVGKYDYSGNNGLFNTINRFKNTNAFGSFAHPEDTDYGDLLTVQYQPLADSAIVGSAVENGPAFSDEINYNDHPSTMSYLQYYKGMLARGYHIGPTIDHDNHNLTFGHTSRSRLVVLSPSLNKDDFMKAMRSRNFYATHSCTAVMDFQLFGKNMGSEMEHADAPAMVVTISDPSTSQQPVIKIYKGTNDGNIASLIATGNSNSFSYTDENLADGSSAYYFTDISIGNKRTISSPIWYHRNDNAVTSIPKISAEDDLSLVIYGNPVRGSLLQFKLAAYNYGLNETILIRDIYGRTILTTVVKGNDEAVSLNVSGLPAGVYVLSVLSDKKEYHKKFVKY